MSSEPKGKPSEKALELARKHYKIYTVPDAEWYVGSVLIPGLAREFDAAIRKARLEEHKLTCHKALLQYDEKGRLTGNLRCGEDWKCERRAELEAGH